MPSELVAFFAGQDDVRVSLDGAIHFNPEWATEGRYFPPDFFSVIMALLEDACNGELTAAVLHDDDDEMGGEHINS